MMGELANGLMNDVCVLSDSGGLFSRCTWHSNGISMYKNNYLVFKATSL